RGQLAGVRAAPAHRAVGRGRGGRGAGRLPGQRRGRLHHRRHPRDRWWLDRLIDRGAGVAPGTTEETALKLVRYGNPGQERPGILNLQGRVRDLGAVVGEIDGAVFAPGTMERLRALDVDALPLV